jgi:hypothetical protein
MYLLTFVLRLLVTALLPSFAIWNCANLAILSTPYVEIRTRAVGRNVMHLKYSTPSNARRISIIRPVQGHLKPMNCYCWTAYLSWYAELTLVEPEIQNYASKVKGKVTPQSKYQSYSRRRGKNPRIR